MRDGKNDVLSRRALLRNAATATGGLVVARLGLTGEMQKVVYPVRGRHLKQTDEEPPNGANDPILPSPQSAVPISSAQTVELSGSVPGPHLVGRLSLGTLSNRRDYVLELDFSQTNLENYVEINARGRRRFYVRSYDTHTPNFAYKLANESGVPTSFDARYEVKYKKNGELVTRTGSVTVEFVVGDVTQTP